MSSKKLIKSKAPQPPNIPSHSIPIETLKQKAPQPPTLIIEESANENGSPVKTLSNQISTETSKIHNKTFNKKKIDWNKDILDSLVRGIFNDIKIY